LGQRVDICLSAVFLLLATAQLIKALLLDIVTAIAVFGPLLAQLALE
jgi:hypothetical protein